LLAVLWAIRQGRDLSEVHSLSKIDPWFLGQFAQMAALERGLQGRELT
jgi:hypothetical protein